MGEIGLMEGVESRQYQNNQPGSYSKYDRERPNIVIRKFERKYKPDPNNPQAMIEEHWVEWGKPGQPNWATRQNVRQLMPRPNPRLNGVEMPAAPEWQVVGPAYQAWLKGEAMPVHGTPLHAWPGLPREAADELKKLDIHTVETLAGFPDHRISSIPFPNFRDWIKRAKAYVEAKGFESVTGLGDRLKERDDRIEALAAESKAKDDLLAEMSARLAALEEGRAEPPKRGPGRPRKITEVAREQVEEATREAE